MLIMCQTMLYFLFLLFGVLLAETSAISTCGKDEIPCLESNETCIPNDSWCDGEFDCPDGSDEHFCYGGKCLLNHFTCDNGKCVPFELVCNGKDDCGDRSDETCVGNRNTTDQSRSVLAVLQAAHYLLSQRKADYGWDDFTPRALIALAFAEKYLPISEKEKSLMTKRLDLQIFFLLRDGVKNLASLALHIDALYAMCKDPRDFHGIDLVEILRSKTEEAMRSDFNLPIVLATLCLANETNDRDLKMLTKMYDNKRNNRVGVKALTVIAMSACNRQSETERYNFEVRSKMNDFIRDYRNNDENIDVYSKALICQAYNAMVFDASSLRNKLLHLQTEDGSFGDLLATYSAIPALLNMSLADLQCKTRAYKDVSGKSKRQGVSVSDQIFKPEKEMDYSLWIASGESAGWHTLRITFEGVKSFFDVMKMAELRNPMYRFKYDSNVTGKKVYYLAGIPNDAEKGTTWTLYRQKQRSNVKNSTTDRQKEMNGVDKIFPEDGDHFMFELETVKYSGQ